MKILYDYQIFSVQKYGGISRYFFELMNNKRNEINFELPILYNENFYLNNFKNKSIISKFNFRGKKFLINLLNKIFFILKIKKIDFDIFHPTYYDPYFLRYLDNKPFVLTVHDMTHEKYEGIYFSKNNKTIRDKRKLIKKASKIIAISENTKRDIINCYNIPENKIKVIYLANSLNPQDGVSKVKTSSRYLLFVGNRSGYKNFNFFVESVAPILNKKLNVFCAGGGKFNEKEVKFLKGLNVLDFVEQKNVNDKELVFLYKNAEIFVFPSLYEGFGIPTLEAFACGCPVILNKRSSLPEVGGKAVEYYNWKEKKSLLSSVEKILNNKKYKEELIEKGYEQLKNFSWDKTTRETIMVYGEILGEN
jgi:glycosyltransferase involved in cell wall biosynthesis